MKDALFNDLMTSLKQTAAHACGETVPATTVAQKIGVVETTAEFIQRPAGLATSLAF